MEPKISIIVPMYNVERYLKQCVESLCTQMLPEVELILVDDGSPDACGQMAEEMARRDHRIRVIHQQHAGLGAARNRGLSLAKGEYVAFVDGDDWVLPPMYRTLYRAAKAAGADIALGGCRKVARGRSLSHHVHPLAGQLLSGEALEMAGQRLLGPAPGEELLPVSACMSLYRRELAETLAFRSILSEDLFFNLDAFRIARRVIVTEGTDYCYRREGQTSITQTFAPETPRRYREFLAALLEKAEEEGCIHRAGATALGAVRTYAGLLSMAALPMAQKRKHLAALLSDPSFLCLRGACPPEALSCAQCVFQKLLDGGHFAAALFCCRLRRWWKEGRFVR